MQTGSENKDGCVVKLQHLRVIKIETKLKQHTCTIIIPYDKCVHRKLTSEVQSCTCNINIILVQHIEQNKSWLFSQLTAFKHLTVFLY